MGKLIDLTGEKFGILSVVRKVENDRHGQAKWSCVCNCGNVAIVLGINLRSGREQCCGCAVPEEVEEDLTGNAYGLLIVTKKAPQGQTKKPRWHCICSCGTRTIVIEGNLKCGNSTSCGRMRCKAKSVGATWHGSRALY